MAQQDTNQLIQEDPATQPLDPLVGTADTSTGTAAPQPITTPTEAPAPPPEPTVQEVSGVKLPGAVQFQPGMEVPQELTQTTPEQTVAGQIEKITATESPLMLAAKTRAEQAAHQRGLGQSTLAIEAGQKALLETALPIAQADAATAANKANQLLQGYIQSGLSAQQATQQSQLLLQEALSRGLLSQQEAEQAKEQIELSGQIQESEMRLADQLNRDSQEFLLRLGEDLKTAGLDEQRSQDLFNNYSGAIRGLVDNRSSIINAIQSQPGVDVATKAALINQVNNQFYEDVANFNAIYTANPDWDDSWALFGGDADTVEGSAESAGALATSVGGSTPAPTVTREEAEAAITEATGGSGLISELRDDPTTAAATMNLSDAQYAGFVSETEPLYADADLLNTLDSVANRKNFSNTSNRIAASIQSIFETYGSTAGYAAFQELLTRASKYASGIDRFLTPKIQGWIDTYEAQSAV